MNNLKYKYLLCFFLIVGLLSACKSNKETTTAEVALEKVSKEERFSRIIRSAVIYNTLSSNLKFTVKSGNSGKELSVDTQLRIIKNEAIQFSFRIPILGTEAFKVIITPENLIVIDRINKQYLQESMKTVKAKFPIDFDYYSLEALLTNNVFIAGKKEVSFKDFSSFQIRENDYVVVLTGKDKQGIEYNFNSDFTDRIQQTQMEQHKLNAILNCEYTDWGLTSNKNTFPMSMKFTLNIPNKVVNINMISKGVSLNTNFTIDYNIPSKYKQINLQQFINITKKLL